MTSTSAAPASLRIVVNGDPRGVTPGQTLAGLLADLGLDPRLIVVERNREILRDRAAYATLELEAGDVLELVHFVGGG